jgi:uncharacterized alkaline shock family protein YloU
MNQFVRFSLIVLSFILAVFILVFLLIIIDINGNLLNGMIQLITRISDQTSAKAISIVLSLVIMLICLSAIVYGIMSGRLRRTRIRNTDIGTIDIGVDAIESIALNSAKSAQCGIKSAKARIAPFKGEKISVLLSTVLYSDVEVPAMMAKVQDRIKKDIERYTGIPVAKVTIQVSRVEPVAARIER